MDKLILTTLQITHNGEIVMLNLVDNRFQETTREGDAFENVNSYKAVSPTRGHFATLEILQWYEDGEWEPYYEEMGFQDGVSNSEIETLYEAAARAANERQADFNDRLSSD
jgi:hypothetical protein